MRGGGIGGQKYGGVELTKNFKHVADYTQFFIIELQPLYYFTKYLK